MNDMKRKSLDEVSDESENFEEQWEQLVAGDGGELERERLLATIASWVQDCAWQGRFIPLGSADRRAFRSLIEHWSSRLRHKGFRLEGLYSLAEFDPSAGVPLTVECPYPGLDPYTQSRRGNFFGREGLIASCIAHLEQPGNRILLIIGASGSGKSSLALAGILPSLEELHQREWLFGPRLTPGAHPLAALTESVTQAIGRPEQAAEIQHCFAAEPDRALERLGKLYQGKQLMLLIDQFEELLTLCRDAGEQRAFAQALCALSDPSATAGGFACKVLLTLRTDHLARFESNDTLQPLHRRLVGADNDRYISGIGFSDIRRAIKEPADQVGLRFVPPDLIDRLASQTAGLANGLPLLQFALRRLWETRPQNELGEPLDLITEEMVQDLPDVERALGTVAAGIFQTFTASQQRVCERLLQELVVLDESFEEPLRRRRNEAELTEVLRARFPAEQDIARVIGDFVAAGLLRRFGEEPDRQLEVAHEALLRHWGFIYALLTGAEVKERLHLIKQIGREAEEWAGRDRPDDYLTLKGERLDRAIEYAKDGWLADAVVIDYIEACKKLEEEERLRDHRAAEAEKARQAAELRAERMKSRVWKLGLAFTVVLLMAIFGRLWSAWEVSFAQRLAMAAEGEIDRDSQRGLLLALEAAHHSAAGDFLAEVKRALQALLGRNSDVSVGSVLLPEVERALRSAVRGSSVLTQIKGYGRTDIQVSALSSDGTVLATGDSVGGVILWDTRTGVQRKALFAHVGDVEAIAFSPDGRTMASGGRDGKVIIWDVGSGTVLHVLTDHVDKVNRLAFSRPDGRLLASASGDASVRLWDVSEGKRLRALYGHNGGVRALAFGRDERQLVTAGDDNRVVVWEASSGRVLYSLYFPGLFDVDLSADGSKLAVAGEDVEIWDFVTRSRLLTVSGHTNSVTSVRFSQDPTRMATASYDGTIRVWRLPREDSDTRQAKEMARFLSNTLRFTSLAFSSMGDTVAATSIIDIGKHVVTVWSVNGGGELLTLGDLETAFEAVAFSPDGRTITAAGDGRVLTWDLDGKRVEVPAFTTVQRPAKAMVSNNKGSLAVGSGTDVLVVQPGMSAPLRLQGHPHEVNDLAFSPDGSRLVSTSHDRTAIVWELPSRKQMWKQKLPGHNDHVLAVAYSPDGMTIATGSEDKTIRLWQADTGEPLGQPMEGHHLGILDLAFSVDGRLLVSGGKDKTVRIWDVSTREETAVLSGHTDVVNAVAVHGDYLATGADDAVRLWALPSGKLVTAFSGRNHGAQSLALSPDGRYLAAGTRDGVVRVYALHSSELVELALQRVHRGWTDEECKQFLEDKACPRSRYRILDDAYRSFNNFDFDTGEQLLREAKGAADADGAALSEEVDAHVGTVLMWGASMLLAAPEQWTDLTKSQNPREVVEMAFKLLVAAKQRLRDPTFDPQARLRDLIVYRDVRHGRDLARAGKIKEAVITFEKARAGGWVLPYEPEGMASRLHALSVFADAWHALTSEQPSIAEIESHAKRVEEALQRYPEMGPAHRVLAEFYRLKENFEGAEEHYLKAAEMESSAEPLVWLAETMIELDPKKAADYANKALERDRGSDHAWYVLGQAEHELENRQAAAFAFDQVSPSSSFFPDAASNSAALQFEYLGDDQAAYQRLTRAVELAPDNLSILANYAELLLALGRSDQAKIAAARAREHPDAQMQGEAYVQAAMSFVLFGAEVLSGDRKQALVELGELERHVQAAASESKDSPWQYNGIRRSLERMTETEPQEQRNALLEVLNFVESNGQSGTLDDVRRLLSSARE